MGCQARTLLGCQSVSGGLAQFHSPKSVRPVFLCLKSPLHVVEVDSQVLVPPLGLPCLLCFLIHLEFLHLELLVPFPDRFQPLSHTPALFAVQKRSATPKCFNRILSPLQEGLMYHKPPFHLFVSLFICLFKPGRDSRLCCAPNRRETSALSTLGLLVVP